MTAWQKAIRYAAIALAILLVLAIVGGVIEIIGSIANLFESGNTVGENKTYTVEGPVTALDIDLAAAELIIQSGEAFSVESNLTDLIVKEKDGTLILEEDDHPFGYTAKGAKLTLTIPQDTFWESASITTGAGRVTIEFLHTQTLRMELGAGEVAIESLIAEKSAEIDGGAGKLSIESGALSDLDMDMGVGEVIVKSRLTGDCEIDHGVGSATLVLIGTAEEYAIELDKGLGEATLDGKTMTDGGVYGNGENKVSISGGVGAITVTFQEPNT